MARTDDVILMEIRAVRRLNRMLYALLEDDKTMDLVGRYYAADPEGAKQWHLKVLENDVKILQLTRELCGSE